MPFRMHVVVPNENWVRARNRYYGAWYDMADKLSLRNITYQKDLLPAISGVAQMLLSHFDKDDQYLAALWKNDIAVGLLWCVRSFHDGRIPVATNLPNYGQTEMWAPSWSWTSRALQRVLIGFSEHTVPGGVYNKGLSGTELISSNVELSNLAAPMDLVRSAILILGHGYLKSPSTATRQP